MDKDRVHPSTVFRVTSDRLTANVSTGPAVIDLMDGFAMTFRERAVEIRNRKAQALMALLAIDGVVMSRERICGLLWSETTEEKARASLRQTLHGLKEALDQVGCTMLQVGRDAIGLGEAYRCDIGRLLDLVRDGDIAPVLLSRQRLPDMLLVGFDDLDPAFRIWLLVQRQTFGDKLAASLTRLLSDLAIPPERMRNAARALLNLDPTNEEACRRLMEDAAARGDVAVALRIYKRLWDLLDDEYGTEPSAQTQALVVRLKSEGLAQAPVSVEPPAATLAASSAPEDHPYLIVSPFESSGLEKQYQHLGAGLRHELIGRLVRFREWSVLDGGQPVDVARLPGRSFLLEAILRQTGPKLSLTLTTKEAPSGRYVWSDSFSVDRARWFEIEPMLLRQVAAAVNVQLTAERVRSAIRPPGAPLGVYESWLQGQQLILGFTPEGWTRAEEIFRSIHGSAPSFSPAFSSLVQLQNTRHLVFPGLVRTQEQDEEALRLAAAAVQIDPLDSRAHLAHAWALAFKARWAQAQQSLELALKLNENDPWTLSSVALATAFVGLHDAAIERADQALALVPQPPPVHWAYQATLRFICRDYAGAAGAADYAGGAIANLPGWHAAALAHLGERQRARKQVELFLSTIRQLWKGGEVSDEKILTWFLSAFPIKLEADRTRLREGIELALA